MERAGPRAERKPEGNQRDHLFFPYPIFVLRLSLFPRRKRLPNSASARHTPTYPACPIRTSHRLNERSTRLDVELACAVAALTHASYETDSGTFVSARALTRDSPLEHLLRFEVEVRQLVDHLPPSEGCGGQRPCRLGVGGGASSFLPPS